MSFKCLKMKPPAFASLGDLGGQTPLSKFPFHHDGDVQESSRNTPRSDLGDPPTRLPMSVVGKDGSWRSQFGSASNRALFTGISVMERRSQEIDIPPN
jgi:hypothetical protein